mgnify:CR=1 FL=1
MAFLIYSSSIDIVNTLNYIIPMIFEWDPDKDITNQRKHGISFSEAKDIFDDPLQLSILDQRFSYFEERWITIGQTKKAHVLVVANLFFNKDGEEVIRLISAREATANERRQYEEI